MTGEGVSVRTGSTFMRVLPYSITLIRRYESYIGTRTEAQEENFSAALFGVSVANRIKRLYPGLILVQ